MFRFWYSACRWSFVPFVLTAAILGASPLIRDIETPWITYPLAALLNLSIGSLIALGATGAVLGIWGCIWGIKSACPQCGASAPWEIPERNYLAINCEKCGLIGGHLLKDARSRFFANSMRNPMRILSVTKRNAPHERKRAAVANWARLPAQSAIRPGPWM